MATNRKKKDDIDDQAEVAAIAAEGWAMKEAAMDHQREKKFDGRYNTDDGTHILPGYTGRGINKFVATRKHKKDDVEDQHEGEMANVKKEFEDRETVAKNK